MKTNLEVIKVTILTSIFIVFPYFLSKQTNSLFSDRKTEHHTTGKLRCPSLCHSLKHVNTCNITAKLQDRKKD